MVGVERMTFPGVAGERLSEEVTFEQDLNDEKKANRQTERSISLAYHPAAFGSEFHLSYMRWR